MSQNEKNSKKAVKIDIFACIEKVFLLDRKVTMENQNDATNHYCNRIFHRVDACNMGHHGATKRPGVISGRTSPLIHMMQKERKTPCLCW